VADDEFRGAARGLGVAGGVVGAIEHRPAFGEGRDHQAVPGGEDLVVPHRAHALTARRHQQAARAVESGLHFAGGRPKYSAVSSTVRAW